jgi:two-component system chemotaxis response regulator CheY
MRRCLVVDDSQVVRKVARRILTDAGFLVGEAATGAEALAICQQEMPEIILVDSLLPDTDSIDLIAKLSAIETTNSPFIIYCTHELKIAQVMRARRAGAKGHMLKPFVRQQVLDSFRGFDELAVAS